MGAKSNATISRVISPTFIIWLECRGSRLKLVHAEEHLKAYS